MPRQTKKAKIIPNTKAKIVKDKDENEHYVIVEEKTYFTLRNLRPGPLFFKREDGKEDYFSGSETKDDITEKERELLIGSLDFQEGTLVEETEGMEETLLSKNSFSDSKLVKIIETNKDDIEKLKSIVSDMDSEFAINRIRNFFVSKDLPSSLIVFCDYKLKLLEEEQIEKDKAPIDSENKEKK